MDAQTEFKIVRAPKAPYWRDPKYIQRRQRRNLVVALASLLCGAVCFLPPKHGYSEAISLQIARGEAIAVALFILMGATVLAAVPTLIRAKRIASSGFCLMVAGGLWALASTEPNSTAHLTAFVFLAFFILVWAWGLWATLQDGRLLALSLAATLGAAGCLFSFGIGERMMILSSLAFLNTLLLSDLLE
jgi:hypothetical protein